MTHCDVLIVGSGAAGQTVAAACAAAGRAVAVVDRLPFGGTCALRGCIPKKVLLAGAETVERARALAGSGVEGVPVIDWARLVERARGYTEPVPAKTTGRMRDAGITTLRGTARFASPDTIEIDGERYSAEHIVLATGARPLDLGFEGADLVTDSTGFLGLEGLPDHVTFVGGGFISFEFAWLAFAAGSRVTIAHRSAGVLAGFDPGLAEKLVAGYRARGIEVLLDAPVSRVTRGTDGVKLHVAVPDGSIETGLVVHGAGRIPDLDALDLERGSVAHEPRGVTVDASLRSVSNPRVWAAGDAAATGAPLTPVAAAQGEVVAANILGDTRVFDDTATPSVVFSDPPLARVGLDVAAAADDSRFEVTEFNLGTWFTQSRLGNDVAGARLVVERQTGRVAGAHLLGIGAEEIINVFALAIRFDLTVEMLKTVTWSYPTFAYELNYLTGRY